MLVLLACSDDAPAGDTDATDTDTAGTPAVCGPETCDGCCDGDTCVAGDADDACGGDGLACLACTDVGNVCSDAVCFNEDLAENGLVDDSALHVIDPDRTRADLVAYLWGDDGLPTSLEPAEVVEVDAPVACGEPLKVDRLRIDMDEGFVAYVYAFTPKEWNGRAVLYHQGHSHGLDENGGCTTIAFFLDRGYTVLASGMPGLGENTGPYANHDEIMAMELAQGDPMRFFLEPSIAAVNWVGPAEVAMIGISGGGWTATVLPAIDTRIGYSFPVAGSLPLYLRSGGDVGDSEQYDPDFYGIAGYPDLYVLAADRGQVQVLNRYDSCCFAGTRYQEYEAMIQAEGTWDAFLDESFAGHLISEHALGAGVIHVLEDDGVFLVDDLAPAWGDYATAGDWTAWTGQGFGGDVQQAALGDANAVASWTVTVPAGTYRVSATWSVHENRATDAPYEVDGTEVRVDQTASPADREDAGVGWEDLATVASAGTIAVTLNGDADGYVIADGVRVERVE